MKDKSPLLLTDTIIDIVERTLTMLDDEWYQYWKKSYTPLGYMRDMKVIRLQLPRRSGMTTAAWRLWDAHPTAHLYMPRGVELDMCRRERMVPPTDRRSFIMPDIGNFWGDRIRGHESCEMVIFDGVSRMKPDILEEVCVTYEQTYSPKLYVLLG